MIINFRPFYTSQGCIQEYTRKYFQANNVGKHNEHNLVDTDSNNTEILFPNEEGSNQDIQENIRIPQGNHLLCWL